jgi:PhnB protein
MVCRDRSIHPCQAWQRLLEGASIQQELGLFGGSLLHGMLSDRFGVTWVLSVVTPMPV